MTPPEPWTHHDAELNGVRLHWVEAGSGPLVVLLHGFPELHLAWRHQIPALAAAGFRAVAPDLRGYSLSGKPRGVRSYRMRLLTGDVAALVRHLGHEKAHVAGHDWGGAIAWCLPRHHPGLVDRLAILNAPHPVAFRRELWSEAQRTHRRFTLLFQLPFLPERRLRAGRAAFLARMLRKDPVRPGAFTEEDIERYREAFLLPGVATATVNYYRAIFRTSTLREGWDERPVDVPTLVLWGQRDRYLGAGLLVGLERWAKDLTLELIPDASHWLPVDAAERVTASLVRFFGAGTAGPG